MAKYPDWVMKYKKKGTYINYTNGKYYLYAAHSERIRGTKKVKRVFDGYIGRISEEEGLIPVKDKVSGDVAVYEYGLSTLLLSVSNKIHKGFLKSSKDKADFIIVAAILTIIYGQYDNYLYQQSYLSVRFPELDMSIEVANEITTAIERAVRMIRYKMNEKFNSDTQKVCRYFYHLYKVRINDKYYLSVESPEVLELKEKYKIEWSD